MCEQCDELQRKIRQYRRFTKELLDALTLERIKAAIGDLEKRQEAMHCAALSGSAATPAGW
jgi:hypothetical protein